MTTEDSTENMPDVIYAGFTEIAKGPVWFPEKKHGALEYYSQAELDRRIAEAERLDKEAYKEACYLAVTLCNKYYKEDAPYWEVLTTTAGVITQIDNMITGIIEGQGKAVRKAEERQRERCVNAYLALVHPSVLDTSYVKRIEDAILNAGGKSDE